MPGTRRRTAWLLAVALIATGCNPEEDEAEARTSASDPTTTTTTLPQAEPEEQEKTGPGRLVILDETGNVVVIDPDGSNRTEITTDAGADALYIQPIWSPDAAYLSWGEVRPEGFRVGIGGLDSTESRSIELANPPFYMYWSPDSTRLALLRNGETGIDFELVDPDENSVSVLDSGQPFYFSWSPAGDRVVTHVGSDRIEVIDLDGSRTDLGTTDAGYLAPQWTPAGIFHVAEANLVLEDEKGERKTLVEVSGLTTFVANPQGTHVALQLTGAGDAQSVNLQQVPVNVTVVVDVATLRVDTVTRQPPIGFFWSPDGAALLVLAVNPERDRLIPMVWRVDGSRQDFDPFIPPASRLRDLFPFFPQYAQSMSFWAADSSAFAFAGLVDGQSGVWVQDLAEPSPHHISAGTWVAWSP